MPPKKDSKRKEGIMAERGKKKLRIDGNESGSEDYYVPPGFARLGLAKWAEGARRSSLRSGASMTRETRARKLAEPEHELATTKCGRSYQATHQAANYSEESENTINKSSDLASNLQPTLIENSSLKDQVPVINPKTEDERRAHSITLTEIARPGGCNSDEDEVQGPALVTVAGCKLKEELAPTARIIEKTHGDILTKCTFNGDILRSYLFENVCSIYKRLEIAEFIDIKVSELERMKNVVCDLLKANVDVGWLANRLDEIHHAKETLLAAPDMKTQRVKKQERVLELEKKVHELQKELECEKEDADKIRGAHLQAKYEVMRFYKKSLVNGI